jgi:hypothetical protein
VKSSIERRQSGQAMVEFVLFSGVLSLFFSGILFFGNFGKDAFFNELSARNRAVSCRGERNNALFRSYVHEKQEMIGFVYEYERKINPGALAFTAVSDVETMTFNDRPYPFGLKRPGTRAVFAVDRHLAQSAALAPGAVTRLIGGNLFGEEYMHALP